MAFIAVIFIFCRRLNPCDDATAIGGFLRLMTDSPVSRRSACAKNTGRRHENRLARLHGVGSGWLSAFFHSHLTPDIHEFLPDACRPCSFVI